MWYAIENNNLVEVKKITVDGVVITNPTDAMIDEAGAGYSYNATDSPEYDADTKKLVHTYIIQNGAIVDNWEVVNLSNAEKITVLQNKIATINSEFEQWKNQPITFDGSGYLPRWVNEYYNSMMILGSSIFPMNVADYTGAAKEFTYEQFVALYQYLIQKATEHTAEVNAQITALNQQIEELQDA